MSWSFDFTAQDKRTALTHLDRIEREQPHQRVGIAITRPIVEALPDDAPHAVFVRSNGHIGEGAWSSVNLDVRHAAFIPTTDIAAADAG